MAAPTFNAVGTGAGSGVPNHTVTVAAGDTALVWLQTQGTVSPTVTIGGVAATLLASVTGVGTTAQYVFGLLTPPVGTNLSVTFGGISGLATYCAANTVTYKGVSKFGTPVTANSATGGTASVSVPSANGHLVANAFVSQGAFSAYNQTHRWDRVTAVFVNNALWVGDAPGASTVNFSISVTAAWQGIGVPLEPKGNPKAFFAMFNED